MTIRNMKAMIAALLLALLVCFGAVMGGQGNLSAFAATDVQTAYENTNILDNLEGSTIGGKEFNIADYPHSDSGQPQILKIEKERGTMDGRTENKKYYLMNAKIYAKRFSTDCFSDYFNDMAKKSKTGLMDYIEYVTEKATVDELKMQNSYFINSLYGNADNGSA